MARECLLAQPSSTGRVKFLSIMLNGNTLSREWGLIEGATQTSSNTYEGKNIGKKNEKTPEQVAEEAYFRLIERKEKNGYSQFGSLDDAMNAKSDIMDLDNPPKSFTGGKPITTDLRKEQHEIDALFITKNALVQEKENGLCHYFIIDSRGIPKIYTRKFVDHSRKYQALIDILEHAVAIGNIEPGTMFMAEIIVPDHPDEKLSHMDRFKRIQEIAKANVLNGELKDDLSKSDRRIAKYGIQAVVFNMLYKGGVFVGDVPYILRYKTIKGIFEFARSLTTPPLIRCARLIDVNSLPDLKQLLLKRKHALEGAVVWKKNGITEITFNGTPKRVDSWKAKLHDPADVVAYDWLPGEGKRQNKIGSLKIGMYSKDGEFIDLGTVGSGLTDVTAEPTYWKFPRVISIEFNGRFEDTGRFQFPRYVGIHPDKRPEECLLEDKYLSKIREAA